MILETKMRSPDTPAIAAMRASGLAFYATGSRYMGGWRDDSDWDFMVQDSDEARDFLTSLGFSNDKLAAAREYGVNLGTLTNAVVELKENGHTIQVQLCRDVNHKRRVRDVIGKYLYLPHLRASRAERHYLWEEVGRVLSWEPESAFSF